MEKSSLLAKIKSKYILQEVLCITYGDMKSVLKLVKYNKSLLNKLEINIEKNYKYEIKTRIHNYEKNYDFLGFIIFDLIYLFIWIFYFLLQEGKVDEKNLKDGYSVKKKKFLDFMNLDFLLYSYAFNFISCLFKLCFLDKPPCV